MDTDVCFEWSTDLEMCFMCSPTIPQRTFITKCLPAVRTARKTPISKNRISLPAQQSLMWFTHKQNDMWQQYAVNKDLVLVIMPQAELVGWLYAGSVCLKSSLTSGVSHGRVTSTGTLLHVLLTLKWFFFISVLVSNIQSMSLNVLSKVLVMECDLFFFFSTRQNQLILLDTLDQEVTKFRECNALMDLNSLVCLHWTLILFGLRAVLFCYFLHQPAGFPFYCVCLVYRGEGLPQ